MTLKVQNNSSSAISGQPKNLYRGLGQNGKTLPCNEIVTITGKVSKGPGKFESRNDTFCSIHQDYCDVNIGLDGAISLETDLSKMCLTSIFIPNYDHLENRQIVLESQFNLSRLNHFFCHNNTSSQLMIISLAPDFNPEESSTQCDDLPNSLNIKYSPDNPDGFLVEVTRKKCGEFVRNTCERFSNEKKLDIVIGANLYEVRVIQAVIPYISELPKNTCNEDFRFAYYSIDKPLEWDECEDSRSNRFRDDHDLDFYPADYNCTDFKTILFNYR